MNLKHLFISIFAMAVFSLSAAGLDVDKGKGLPQGGPVVLGQNFPNPAKGKTEIVVEFSTPEAVLRIYNVLGKKVEEIVVSSDKKVIILDVSDYQEGIYLYSIEAGGEKVTKRMTVRK